MNKKLLKQTTWEAIAWAIIVLFVVALGVNAIFE